MPRSDLTALASRLGVGPERLSPLGGCAQADVDRLAALVGSALLAEDEAVERGLRKAVTVVPLPLRGRARSLLLGDDRR